MDLQQDQPRPPASSAVEALHKLPNNLRLSAIESTIRYLTKSESNTLYFELIERCEPPHPQSSTPDRSPLAAVLRPFSDRRRHRDTQLAYRAQSLVIREWERLDPVLRRVALSLEGIDWPARAHETLNTDPACKPAVAQLLADHAGQSNVTANRPTGRANGAPLDPRRTAQTWSPSAPSRGLDDPTLRLMLGSGNRDAVETAETALLARIRLATDRRADLDSGSRRSAPATVRDAVAAALIVLETEDGAERTPLVRAALRLLDRPLNEPASRELAPLTAILTDRDHPGFAALRRALKRDPAPEVRRIAWRLLAPGPLALACLERLGNARTPAEHDAVLERAHLILNPARRDLLASLGTPNRGIANRKADSALAPLLPTAETVISGAAERGLASLLANNGVSAGSRTEARSSREIQERLLTAPNTHARLACARLADTADLADWTLDPDPAVATLAALRRSTLGVRTPGAHAGKAANAHAEPLDSPRLRHTRLLTRSPHDTVRRIAREDIAPSDFFDAAGTPSVRSIALAQHAPDELARALADLLDGSTDASHRVRAILVAVRLRIADRLGEPLAKILASPATNPDDARVAATAASALGAIPSRASLSLALAAIDRPDPRVRANAVESLERLAARIDAGTEDRSLAGTLTEIKQSEEHRSRANAVRAVERLRLANAEETHDDLAGMLSDDRAPHRLAGAWLTERMLCDPRRVLGPDDPAWQSAARRVAALAREEADPHVRARAVRCARRLLDEINSPGRGRRDPAIDRAARRIRALADAHPDAGSLPDGSESRDSVQTHAGGSR